MRELTACPLSEKLLQHVYHARTVLNRQALFSDEGPNYVNPAEPVPDEPVRLTIRTARNNVDQVCLCMNGKHREMTLARQTQLFDYYETDIIMGEDSIIYHYEVLSGSVLYYYNKKGVSRSLDTNFDFRLIPGFSTPDWAKGAVMYQIFVDRFANGNPSNDVMDHEYVYIYEQVTKVTDWGKYPKSMGVREFYGGDLQGILDHLDYLKDLGVDVLYLNPIFVSPSNHKYDIQDYDHIDPHFTTIPYDTGDVLPDWASDNTHANRYINRVTNYDNLKASNAFFASFVEEVHKRGMKVILDGVFNHCGSFNKWMDAERIYEYQPDYSKGAFIEENSPYHDFFRFFEHGTWPYNDEFEGWWGHRTLPKLNYEGSQELYNYIMKIASKWVSPPYNADGWRLDVAADLGRSPEMNHQFWRDFRRVVKEANPEAIILAEHYGDPYDWLKGDQWDTIMNYNAFMEPVTWFLTGMEKHSDERRDDLLANSNAFVDAMVYHMARMNYPSLSISMNELSNHDHSRFLTRTNRIVGRTATAGPAAADHGVDKSVLRSAVLMQMTWPGAPTIYYGDEAGVTGWTDPDNRRTYPWGHEDQNLINFHREMISIHKKHPALMHGSLKLLEKGEGYLSYGRFTEEEKMLVLVNAGDKDTPVSISVWELDITSDYTMKQLMINSPEDYSKAPEYYPVEKGILFMTLPGHSAILLQAIL